MTKTKVIECPTCLQMDGPDVCPDCKGSGMKEIEVELTEEEKAMEHECRMSEGGLSKWL